MSIVQRLIDVLLQRKIKLAKWMGFLSTFSIFTIGIFLSMFVFHYADFISNVMISDRKSLILLGNVCKLYSWFIPLGKKPIFPYFFHIIHHKKLIKFI